MPEILVLPGPLGDLFMEVIHPYPDLTVRLSLYHSHIQSGIPKLLEHNAIRWLAPNEIDELDFCPADTEILARIKQIYGAAE